METLLVAFMLALSGALWATRTPTRTYTGSGLQPCIYPELARTDAGRFGAGTYTKGQVLGQLSTLTAANDVQTVTFTGTPTGGTFRLSLNGEETSAITYSGTAATLAANVQTALEALASVGTGNVTVAANAGAPQATFAGDLAGQWLPLIVFSSNGLTGGTDPTATVAHTTPGRTAGGTWLAYDDSLSDGSNIAKAICQYDMFVASNGRHYINGNTGRWEHSGSFYIAGYFRTADLTGIDAAAVTDLGRIVEGAVGSLSDVGTVIKVG